MKNHIRELAGRTWHALAENGPMTLSALTRKLKSRDRDVFKEGGESHG